MKGGPGLIHRSVGDIDHHQGLKAYNIEPSPGNRDRAIEKGRQVRDSPFSYSIASHSSLPLWLQTCCPSNLYSSLSRSSPSWSCSARPSVSLTLKVILLHHSLPIEERKIKSLILNSMGAFFCAYLVGYSQPVEGAFNVLHPPCAQCAHQATDVLSSQHPATVVAVESA